MSTIPTSPSSTPHPRPVPTGPPGVRPGGPAGPRPAGPAGAHPRARSTPAGNSSIAHRKRLATGFVELFLEVEAGCRPARQLAPLLTPMLYARLTRVWYRGGRPGRVVSVSVIGSEPTTFDAIAVVRRGPRSGAVSLRVALDGGRWRVEELARPEDGELPGPAYRVALDPEDAEEDVEIPVVLLRATAKPAEAEWLLPTAGG